MERQKVYILTCGHGYDLESTIEGVFYDECEAIALGEKLVANQIAKDLISDECDIPSMGIDSVCSYEVEEYFIN